MSNVLNGRDRTLQKIKSLSEFVGAFKTTASKRIHESGMSSFRWQKSFYDRIIRNEKELNRIREYIQINALQWELDIENLDRVSVTNRHVRNARERSLRTEVQHKKSVQDYYDNINRLDDYSRVRE